MPSSIPYNHPSLVLGNIADTKVLDLCNQIQALNTQTEIASDKLNSFMMMKRSLAMTMNELTDLGVDTKELIAKQKEIDQNITSAAQAYLDTRINTEEKIQNIREQISNQASGKSVESPLDFNQSKLMNLPLANESIKLDSQYFSFGSNMQDDVLANVEKFVRSSTENLGAKSTDITNTVSSQINNQIKNHNVAGTLIITASCTYSNVRLFEPLIIDPDKAVAAWNQLYENENGIDTNALKAGDKIQTESKSENKIAIVSGACYGASFIGMIHIIRSQSSQATDMDSVKNELETKLKLGGWISSATGGIGINKEVLNEIKVLLNTQSVSSHISVVALGCIPSISSNKMQQSIQSIVNQDSNIAAKIYDNIDSLKSVNSESEKAVELARSVNIEKNKIQTLLSGLGKIDYEANKTFDINSLMDIYENFTKDNNPNKGVPIGFYLKHLGKTDIESLWINKYYADNSGNKS